MNQKEWKKALQSWQVERDESEQYAEPSTKEELDAFEQEFDVRLPQSYRAFASVVGPGELANMFRIGTPAMDRESLNLFPDGHPPTKPKRRRRKEHDDPASRLYSPEDYKRRNRLVQFCNTFLGDIYGWDPEDPTSGRGGDCGIYVIWRTEYKLDKITSTFDEFIFDFCLGPKYYEFFPHAPKDPHKEGYPFSRPRERFDPCSLGSKPPKSPEPTGIVSSPEYWKRLRKNLDVTDVGKALIPPAKKAFSEYERANGFVLPRGYKEFLSVFGPGQLAHRFHICGPGYSDRDFRVDLAACHARFRKERHHERPLCEDPKLARRLVAFSLVEDPSGTTYLCWDPKDVRNADDCEYAIYVAYGLTFLAASFVDFIENVALSDYWEQRYGSRGVAGPHREFLPVPAEK